MLIAIERLFVSIFDLIERREEKDAASCLKQINMEYKQKKIGNSALPCCRRLPLRNDDEENDENGSVAMVKRQFGLVGCHCRRRQRRRPRQRRYCT